MCISPPHRQAPNCCRAACCSCRADTPRPPSAPSSCCSSQTPLRADGRAVRSLRLSQCRTGGPIRCVGLPTNTSAASLAGSWCCGGRQSRCKARNHLSVQVLHIACKARRSFRSHTCPSSAAPCLCSFRRLYSWSAIAASFRVRRTAGCSVLSALELFRRLPRKRCRGLPWRPHTRRALFPVRAPWSETPPACRAV